MARPPRSGGPAARSESRAVDLALAELERRYGLGRSLAAPGWVRERVLAILTGVAARLGVSPLAAAEQLPEDKRALEEIVGALRVGETRFYRDPIIWEAIISTVLPKLPPDLPIAGLSAGCSTGEEAYTLGMILASAGRRFSVLGVDRSTAAVEAAREAVYSAEAAEQLPPALVQRYCELKGGALHVCQKLRDVVSFEVCDLVHAVPSGGFQIIFFKNVLLYLAESAGDAVARRLAAELGPGGLLFSAASEAPRLCGAGLTPVRVNAQVTAFRAPGT
ncbi:chemotaxis protein methyltransferase [Sorangium cellulosum]|uniref:Chemotaxis protein methyltransferase n=1 Tax=Sorangium cellulosum TaxID=56 RepID=A0A2L0ESE6_SORCE|nr:CheR family methyltransferase [Sorangium cellulosum]AUX42190.1 chemotaxis protein methyltransferase [Sorangium cellulosum]